MPNQGSDCCVSEPEVISDAGEAVPQNIQRDAGQIGIQMLTNWSPRPTIYVSMLWRRSK
jgi:hypothetical protein